MAIQTPSLEDIINSFIENIRNTIPQLSTTPISVTREALINPASTQVSALFDLGKRISVLQDIFQATGSDLDALAATYGLARRAGSTATGTIYFDLTQLNSVSTITVRNGTTIRSTQSGTQTAFYNVVGDYTFTATDRAIYEANATAIRTQLDSVGLTNVKMVATGSIKASTSGPTGNIGAYSLRNISTQNINNVINLSATSGGTTTESDSSLRQRIVAIFTGNSTGTEAGLISAATSVSSVTGAYVVKFGNPLMTRDGSVYDDQGNLITPGTGRAVDVYVQGSSTTSTVQNLVFDIKDSTNFLNTSNGVLLGQPQPGNFGTLPATLVTGITGSESSASFTQGVEVTDEEGNRIIEGNFILIKDVDAEKYSIVENLTTSERKLATFVNPSSPKYTTIQTLKSTDFANSSFSQDYLLFLKETVDVQDELITKSSFNGADQLRFSNVTNVLNIVENKSITDTVKITEILNIAGSLAIQLPHFPIAQVNSIFHTRLGVDIEFELIDAAQGIVRLISRSAPREGDILLVDYIWQKSFYEGLNYNLTGDLINWVSTADERGRSNATLFAEQPLEGETTLAVQPNISSELLISMSGISDRQIIETSVSGQSTEVILDKLALKATNPFTFAVTGSSNVGRVFSVSNISKGFEYNITGYKLKTNKLDPKAGIESSLLLQQFQLSERPNVDVVEVGDKFVLGKPARTLSWSSQADFENNVEDNLSPIYDPTKLDFTAGGTILLSPLLDTVTTPTTVSGLITQDLTLSGIVEITEDLIVGEGVVLTILPETTVKIRPSSQLQSQIAFAQRTTFDGYLSQQDTLGNTPTASQFEEFKYLYFQPTDFNSNYFTIINDVGQILSIRFDQDILTKVITGAQATYTVNNRLIDSSFYLELESTIDLLDVTSTIKATLIGARSGVSGLPKFTAALVPEFNRYYVLLERTPVTSNNVQNDFTLAVEADTSIRFDRFSYNSSINALLVDGTILEIDGYGDTTSATDYFVTHFIEDKQRISIIVNGTLRAVGGSPQTSILFTSAGPVSALGDWEGIVFTAKSHTNNPRTVLPSELTNVRIMYANVGLNIQASDVSVQECVIRDCANTGISISSSLSSVAQYTNSDLELVVLGDPFNKFNSESRVGFSSADNVQIARFPLEGNLVSITGSLPILGTKLSNTRYVVNLQEGSDYKVFLDSQRITEIDTSQPVDGYTDYALQWNEDVFVEFDIYQGYSLVFLYTAGSQKRRKVYDMVIDFNTKLRTGKMTIDYFTSISNGIIFNNLLLNTNVGISTSSLATTAINKNTIQGMQTAITATQSIAEIRNNLITDYTLAPFSIDTSSLIRVRKNDIYSQVVTDQEQTGLLDTDLLLRNISTSTSTLLVRTPSKFKVSMIIKIDNEEMYVQAVNDDSIVVVRAQNATTAASHFSGSSISLYQLNQIFTVTGIDGDVCQIIQTDQNGIPVTGAVPVQMRSLAIGTFRVAFPINRRADFYYKYTYASIGSIVSQQTLVKKFPKEQFGVGVNDVITTLQEIPLSSASYVPNNENFSADPLYTNASSADFSFNPLFSLASRQNPTYGSLVVPNPLHRYVGSIEVQLLRTLGVGETRIPVPYEPLIVESYNEVKVVGVDSLNSNIVLSIKEFSYSVTTAEADLGALGVLIIDPIIHLSGVPVAGQYQVSYVQPTDLGTSIPPNYIEADIQYVVDAGAQVTFDKLVFEKDSIGGEVAFSFQVADSTSDLQLIESETSSSSSPISIEDYATTNEGQVIQINIKIKGNDSTFAPDLSYVFPILESFSLNYLPAKDETEYSVLSLVYNTTQNETNILIDKPISDQTFSTVGSEDSLELYLRKKSDNFDPAEEFLFAIAQNISTGDTFVTAQGNLGIVRPDAAPSDIIRVDYLAYSTSQETLYFTQDGSQYSKYSYSSVDKISHQITQDKKLVLPVGQTIAISGLTQPDSGSSYSASYSFQAPLDGETLTVSYNYNSAVRLAAQEVELKKSIFTDVLVKGVRLIEIRVGLALDVIPGTSPLSVQTQVSLAISNFFVTALSNTQTERRIDTSDIIRATGDVAGIQSISVTTLSRNLVTGEIQDPLIIYQGESATLEENSPRINTTQNGKSLLLGSN